MGSAVVAESSVIMENALGIGEGSANINSAILAMLLHKGLISEDDIKNDVLYKVRNVASEIINDGSTSKQEKANAKLTLLQLKVLANNLAMLTEELNAELSTSISGTTDQTNG